MTTPTPTPAKRRHTAPNPGRILYYSTEIKPEKTLDEIRAILVAHGARSYTIHYDGASATGCTFALDVGGVERHFQFKSNWQHLRKRLIDEHNKGRKTWDRFYWDERGGTNGVPASVDAQAQRTAWRIIKDAIEVMLNLADAGIADVGQILFGFGMLTNGGTIYDAYLERQQALPSGDGTHQQ